ncbi:MAG: cellobiose phosphorylase [Anaerolineae bacterium]|nr:cellobiose phosphorylase [Anaerolineae bacterium]
MARAHTVSRQRAGRVPLLRYLDRQGAILEQAYAYYVRRSERAHTLSQAGEWVLDNYYIVRQSVRQVREDMPAAYYRELPALAGGSLAGCPRIYALTREIVRQSQSRPDEAQVEAFVHAYQCEAHLTMGELWALPTMLRLVILENLTAALLELTDLGEKRERRALFPCEPPSQGIPAGQVVAHAIPTLHRFLNLDWKSLFERLSLVEQALRNDPVGAYAGMDFDTRDRYRKVVEELASESGRSEPEVARQVVHLARRSGAQASGSDAPPAPDVQTAIRRRSHVGYYLLDGGRAELEALLGYRPSFRKGLRRWFARHALLLYLGGIALLTGAALGALIGIAYHAGATALHLAAIGLIGLIPASAVAVDLVNWLVTRVVPSHKLPKLDLQEGIPDPYRTIVVVPAMLTDRGEVDALLRQLELHYLSNPDPNLGFALLTDWADAPHRDMPGDGALVDHAAAGIEELNRAHRRDGVGPFYLFHRERRWNASEEQWMGWERKRGKLAEFNRLLAGSGETSYVTTVGDMQRLHGTRFVITLDADTLLPRDSARRLVGTLAHPLNRPQFDAATGRVVAGYTVLQPRTEIQPTSANQSLFARVFSGDRGVDLYSRAVSDVYQDLFGEGIYVGKGIYDVAAFERSLRDRVPDNSLLSHDLFEGVHGRAGLVTDVVLYEDYPPHYPAYAHRLHRWIRGDWQLLPWLLPRVPRHTAGWDRNPLTALDRWKILDNLRRSLVVPAQVALWLLGWLWWPGAPIVWTLVGALTSAMPVLTGLLSSLSRPAALGQDLARLRNDALRWLLGLVFVPYRAIIALDAIGSTLVRIWVTRRHLLQWTTAAHTLRLFGRHLHVGVTWVRMGGAPALALTVAVLAGLVAPAALPVAAPLLLAWFVSPQIAHWISKPATAEEPDLDQAARRRLRRLARRTWLYYERFVGPGDHWLPPDHYQEDPLGAVAHRTSPTNIGLFLLSTLGAYDMGYVGALELSIRLRDTFTGMQALERHRGHLLNWYDTRSLEPLTPRYVSTVDSGNLAGALIALSQACDSLPDAPVVRRQAWRGFLDTCVLFEQAVHALQIDAAGGVVASLRAILGRARAFLREAPDDLQKWGALLIDLQDKGWAEVDAQVAHLVQRHRGAVSTDALGDLRTWSERASYHLSWMRRELDTFLPWWAMLQKPPALFAEPTLAEETAEAWQELARSLRTLPSVADMPAICDAAHAQVDRLRALLNQEGAHEAEGERAEDALAWCDDLVAQLEEARRAASDLIAAYRDLGARAGAYVEQMDLGFLFDPQRMVFRVGYNVMAERADNSYYDLLASEARIASLVAIAKGDVPQRHWLHISRPLAQVAGTRALLSWSGTMFEYLMPTLLVESHRGTLLDQSCRAVVDRQIQYARSRGVAWGISESAFYQFGANRDYQYRAFGVPGLGLKRGLGQDLVVTPYASLLALPYRPQAVLRNVRRLADMGMLGRYGFFEAVDYTRSRLPLGKRSALIRSYMAHHQGMIMLALVNALTGKLMVQRFHRDPRIQSVALLLHEQAQADAPLEELAEDEPPAPRRAEPAASLAPWRASADAVAPQAHVLSNGAYTTLITGAGGGYSQCILSEEGDGAGEGVFALTRWRADTTRDAWGTWIYVQDRESGALWSAAYQPTAVAPDRHEVWFDPSRAEYRRRDHGISLRMEVTVPPVDNLEIRRITLTNHSDRTRQLAVTSYGEVVLAPQAIDRRHPAFNKLFIESAYLPELSTLLFSRRRRSGDEAPRYMAHLVTTRDGSPRSATYETDRRQFVGRGRTVRAPRAMVEGKGLPSMTTGATLDPIMSLRHEVELAPYAIAELAYVTLAAQSRQEALALATRYRRWEVVTRAFGQAHSQSALALDELDLDVDDVEQFTELFSTLAYPHPGLRPEADLLAHNCRGQPGLWAYGISGDYPILLVRVRTEDETDLVASAVQAHAYWRDRQIMVDLVLLNERETGYEQALQGSLHRLIARLAADARLNQRGGIFVLRADHIPEQDRVLLLTAARAVLDGASGSLADQLVSLRETPVWLPDFVPLLLDAKEIAPTPLLERPTDLRFDNGYGGFTPDGREYVIDLPPGKWTPAPWANVVANPDFGFLVSESGLGCTWAGNSGENRLTPWRNDPVGDRPAEALYLRDEETGQVWTPTPLPVRVQSPYLVRHGAGYTVFEHHSHGLKQRLRVFAVRDAPIKILRLRVENTWARTRRVTATYYAEWVLGTTRDVTQQYVIPEFDPETQALLARNPYNVEFGGRVAFVSASEPLHGLSADRTEFLGKLGDLGDPAALRRIGLSGAVEAGRDPCAVVQVHLELAPGESREVHFLLGQGADRHAALHLAERYRETETVEGAWEDVRRFWDDLLGAVTVHTPDAAMDLLLNRWLLYQTIACRLWGRSALYQSSGAFGFRDQLQDVMAVTYAAPALAREHILRAARHQFAAGDVLHWWHPPSGRGVRTRISDDLLWLPYVVAHYVETTGDRTILEQELPFLEGDPLQPEEQERYGHYAPTGDAGTLYEHCRRALERGITLGRHGLPLIGGGDWNDGMNRVGIEGQGESVWLGWFLYAILSRFAPICEQVGDDRAADAYRQRAKELRVALEEHAWDGEWYLRAYYDNGTPLGSAQNEECQIDSIAQSWAVLSGAASVARAAAAMDAVQERLVRADDRLVFVLTPPFDATPHDPGYIKGYPPGIRENGGQYTHAALWAAWAFAELGLGTQAQALFDLLNPIRHSDQTGAQRYRVEPYVVAADVYSVPPHVGRGGWTWYTGSAGWMYRLGVAGILGLQRKGKSFTVAPRVPRDWDRFSVTYRFGDARYRITVENPEAVEQGVQEMTLDGAEAPDLTIPLCDDGREHAIRVRMG